MSARDVLYGVLLPALVTGALLLWALKLGQLRPRMVWGAAAGLALAAGYIVGQLGILGWNGWLPAKVEDGFIYLALSAGAWSAFETETVRPRLRPERLVLCTLVAFLCLRTGLTGPASIPAPWARFALLALAIWCLWESLEGLAQRSGGWPYFMALLPCGSAAGYALLQGGTASIGQLSGVLTACCGAGLVAALWRSDRPFAAATAAPVAVLYCALLNQGWTWAELPTASALCLYSAPHFLLGAWILVPNGLPALTRWGARALALLVPLALAAWLAGGRDPSPYG